MSNNRLVWCLYRLKCQTIDWFGVYTDSNNRIQNKMSNNRLVWCLYRLKCQTIDWFDRFGVYTELK